MSFQPKIKNPNVQYSYINQELLMKEEVEHLIKQIEQLLAGKIEDEIVVKGLEPNLAFTLIPGSSYEKYCMKVHIWFEGNNGYCGGNWSIRLGEKHTEQFFRELKKEHLKIIENGNVLTRKSK